MRILAIDFGSKRIGLAIARSTDGIAFPYAVIVAETTAEVSHDILSIVLQEDIQKIIVGHPGSLRAEATAQAQKCQVFADELEDFLRQKELEIEVELIDEAFSSELAKRQLKDLPKNTPQNLDAVAAAAFLQTYLEQKFL